MLSRLECVKPNGEGKYIARCPAHDDGNPSLSIGIGDDNKVLLHCFAGCTSDAITKAIGFTTRDLFTSKNGHANGKPKSAARSFNSMGEAIAEYEKQLGRTKAIWNYYDADGEICGLVLRWDAPTGKTIRPIARDVFGGWTLTAMPDPRPLYQLPDLATTKTIIVVEGEKCVDAARSLGFIATTSSGGSNAATKSDWRPLAGKDVLILPDNDAPGRKYAETVAAILAKLNPPAKVRVLELPGLADKGDLVDWIDAHGDAATPDDLRAEIESLAAKAGKAATSPTHHIFDGPPLILGESGEQIPQFPCEELPFVLANFVRAAAESVQVPPDLIALTVLAVAAGGLARKFVVNGDGGQWIEPVNIFTAVAAEPGERKSAATRLALSPVSELEREEIERMRPIVAAAAAEKETLSQRLKKLQADVAKCVDETEREQGMREIARLAVEVENYLVPALPTFIIDDETQESVGKTLAQNNGRLLQAAAEGTLFEIVAGRYSDGENYDVYLKGHAGDPLICGRTSRERYRVERPALTCAMLVQPEVFRKIGSDKARGLGFLGRWAYGVPNPAVGFRKCSTTPINELVSLTYAEVVRLLWTWPLPESETVITFDDEAAQILLDWREKIEPRLRPDGDLKPLGAWGSKLVGLTVRIAAVCHLVDEALESRLNDPAPITAERLAAAIKLAEGYFIPHAFRAFGLMAEPPGYGLANRLLGWLTRKPEIDQFQTRQAYQQHKGARGDCRTVADLKPALELLEAYGYLHAVPMPREAGPGRGPSALWAVNPQWIR
ncbi:MAG: DUF3987 domain-containing protein [Planctomycetia bacterium]|nr:DUF3987 domain-containing protein [Planctomycetia bacterium]